MKQALETYAAARAARIAAGAAKEKALSALRAAARKDRMSAARAYDDAEKAARRARLIEQAAAEIATRKVEAAAAPVVLEVLKKYVGKPAGPKTRQKAAAEIAAILNIRSAYFSSSHYDTAPCAVELTVDDGGGDAIRARVKAVYPEKMVDKDNRFCVPALEIPDVSGLPDDLEVWADDFERVAKDLEAAREEFLARAKKARRVNLGDAHLPEYRVVE